MGMDISGINPAKQIGKYFRANIWSWRPIAELIHYLNHLYKLDLPDNFLDKLHYNDGGGLRTQEECNKLANFLETYDEVYFSTWDSIGLNTGWYRINTVDKNGSINSTTASPEVTAKLEAILAPDIFIKDGIIELDGLQYHTSHRTSREHLKEFIEFLRYCGGFEIW